MGLRRFVDGCCLSLDVAREPDYSHARLSDVPILAQTLRRLSVSRSLG